MNIKKVNFCTFTTLLSIILSLYILITFLIDSAKIDYNSYDANNYFIKIVIFAILFIAVAVGFTLFKLYKNRYIEEQIKQRTEDIQNENQTLKIYSHIDPLTQCLNEKFFMKRFKEEFKRAIREKQNISLFIVNIDEFKSFNDIYGEDEGNECLKIIANILVNHCNRPTDLVSKFEGDEFYVLLPNTKDVKTVCNNCINSVRSLNIPHDNSIASNVLTISIGTSTLMPTDQIEMKELIKKAKESLKKAKISGRNRVY